MLDVFTRPATRNPVAYPSDGRGRNVRQRSGWRRAAPYLGLSDERRTETSLGLTDRQRGRWTDIAGGSGRGGRSSAATLPVCSTFSQNSFVSNVNAGASTKVSTSTPMLRMHDRQELMLAGRNLVWRTFWLWAGLAKVPHTVTSRPRGARRIATGSRGLRSAWRSTRLSARSAGASAVAKSRTPCARRHR